MSVADFRMEGPSQGRIPPLVGSSSLPPERGQSVPLFRRARLFWERRAIDPPLAEGAWVGVILVCCVCVCVWVWGCVSCGVCGVRVRGYGQGSRGRSRIAWPEESWKVSGERLVYTIATGKVLIHGFWRRWHPWPGFVIVCILSWNGRAHT